MKTIALFITTPLFLLSLYSCNDSQKTSEYKLPSDTLAVDVSETQKIIPVTVKGDSTKAEKLPVKNAK